nr:hypothetical protein [Streptosporangium roseum]
MANPDVGIGVPPTTRLIPANSPTAATAAVAAPATIAAIKPPMTSGCAAAVAVVVTSSWMFCAF